MPILLFAQVDMQVRSWLWQWWTETGGLLIDPELGPRGEILREDDSKRARDDTMDPVAS